MTSLRLGRWLLLAAVVGPLAAGAALIPLRDRIDNTNIALLLVVAVVAVASGGRRPAAVAAALSAAAAFNLFHTRPYYSLRIDSSDDIVTALLLLVVGIAVGELALRGRRARYEAAAEGEHDLAQHPGPRPPRRRGRGRRLRAAGHRLGAHPPPPPRRLPVRAGDRTTTGSSRSSSATAPCSGARRAWETDRWGLPTDGAVIPVDLGAAASGGGSCCAPRSACPTQRSSSPSAATLVDQAAPALLAGSTAA